MEHETTPTQQPGHHPVGRTRRNLRRIVAWVQSCWHCLCSPMKWIFTALGTWFGRWPLFATILVWVLLALKALVLVSQVLMGTWIWDLHITAIDSLEVVRISLTIIGGIGAVGYLVIKYQERQANSREEHRTVIQTHHRSFTEAIDMMGNTSIATRIAGVHALASAGTQDRELQSTIIDILCGYLRMERIQDRVVESCILDTIAGVLAKDGQTSWRQDLVIDLHGASLSENFHLTNCTIRGMNLEDMITNGVFILRNVTITGTCLSSYALFTNTLGIHHCTFQMGVGCSYMRATCAAVITDSVFSAPNSYESHLILSRTGSHFTSCKRAAVNLVGAQFTGSFMAQRVECNTDCLLADPSNWGSFHPRPRVRPIFGTITENPDGSVVGLSKCVLQDVTFNEVLLADGMDPIYLRKSIMGGVTISREDVREHIRRCIKAAGDTPRTTTV